MKQIFVILTIFILFTNCKSQKELVAYNTHTLKIIPISKNAYQHITYLETNDFGKVACNGLVYIYNKEAVVFDTPTTTEVSKELIHWITEVKKYQITAVVINHFHADCLGGLEAFYAQKIPSFANKRTIALAKSNNFILPQNGFDNILEITVGNKKVINRFIGEAHTTDNIVSYIPSEKILFGGCMVKSINASKGFLGDANTAEWSNTVKNIKKFYPEVLLIIPGHGNVGNTKLLDYTIALFR